MKKICILGLGYIGLPTASILCENGYNVLGVDINPSVLKKIKKNHTIEKEPFLNDLVEKSIKSGRLELKLTPSPSDVYIICTPTPVRFSGKVGSPDLSYVYSAINKIIHLLKPSDILIIESTIPVGTTKKIKKLVVSHDPKLKRMYFAHCPERVLPGNIIFEIKNNPRIIGGSTKRDSKEVSSFFRSFVNGDIIETNSNVAEMCKLTENSFRDVNIAFANELSILCDSYTLDVEEVIKIANLHPRVNILKPGIGVGGHCIPVDPWFLINNFQIETKLLQTARDVNIKKTYYVIKMIKKEINSFIIEKNKKPVISFLGLSYKPNSGDLRESPAIKIISEIKLSLDKYFLVDPFVNKFFGKKTLALNSAINSSDLVIKLVDHDLFLTLKKDKTNYILLDFT